MNKNETLREKELAKDAASFNNASSNENRWVRALVPHEIQPRIQLSKNNTNKRKTERERVRESMLGLIVRRAVLLLIHRTPTCVFLSLRVGTSKKKNR